MTRLGYHTSTLLCGIPDGLQLSQHMYGDCLSIRHWHRAYANFLLLVSDFKSVTSFGFLVQKYIWGMFFRFSVKPQNRLIWPVLVFQKVFSGRFPAHYRPLISISIFTESNYRTRIMCLWLVCTCKFTIISQKWYICSFVLHSAYCLFRVNYFFMLVLEIEACKPS